MLPRYSTALCVALVTMGAASAARAQVQPLPPAGSGATTIVTSAAAGLFDVGSFTGGSEGELWLWGSGLQFRGGVERPVRRDLSIGLAASFARLPITVEGGQCAGCRGHGDVWQGLLTARLGAPRVGFTSVLEGVAGITRFGNFTRGSDPSSAPGAPTTGDGRIAPTFGVSYGAGYGLSPRLEIAFVQEIGVMLHRSDAGGGGSSTPQFRTTRLTVRYSPTLR